MNYEITEQLAKIAIAKSLVKEYRTNESGRTVYLNVLETINKMNFINKMKSFVSQETWLISS